MSRSRPGIGDAIRRAAQQRFPALGHCPVFNGRKTVGRLVELQAERLGPVRFQRQQPPQGAVIEPDQSTAIGQAGAVLRVRLNVSVCAAAVQRIVCQARARAICTDKREPDTGIIRRHASRRAVCLGIAQLHKLPVLDTVERAGLALDEYAERIAAGGESHRLTRKLHAFQREGLPAPAPVAGIRCWRDDLSAAAAGSE